MSTSTFKVRKSLATTNFVQSLITKGGLAVKQELVSWENEKLNPQLVTDICRFVQDEVASSAFKANTDIDKTQIVHSIMAQLFGDLTDSEKAFVEGIINFAMDHNLVTKKSLLSSVLTCASTFLSSSSK